MKVWRQRAHTVPDRAEPSLTRRLDEKLDALRAAGFKILWIATSQDDLVTLIGEGGEDSVRLDPDPKRDLAWYGAVEIRPSPNPGTWVYLEGEYDEISRHGV